MKDRLIKLTILAILAAVLCAGFIYLDNVIVANAQDTGTGTGTGALECIDDCIEECLETEGCVISVACAAYYAPSTIETVPYPVPEYTYYAPYPAPVTMPFSFPVWFQVILDSLASWL